MAPSDVTMFSCKMAPTKTRSDSSPPANNKLSRSPRVKISPLSSIFITLSITQSLNRFSSLWQSSLISECPPLSGKPLNSIYIIDKYQNKVNALRSFSLNSLEIVTNFHFWCRQSQFFETAGFFRFTQVDFPHDIEKLYPLSPMTHKKWRHKLWLISYGVNYTYSHTRDWTQSLKHSHYGPITITDTLNQSHTDLALTNHISESEIKTNSCIYQ